MLHLNLCTVIIKYSHFEIIRYIAVFSIVLPISWLNAMPDFCFFSLAGPENQTGAFLSHGET
jgi:hypothetical protein